MKNYHIFNEDCLVTMQEHLDPASIDIVLTSPFYATNKKAGKDRTLENTKVKDGQYAYVRYDKFVDNYSNEEYCEFTVKLFQGFDRILKKNGVVLYNINYGSENTEGMFLAIAEVLKNTPFTIADVIGWKKKSSMPNSCSSNRLTRVFEFVFVFCRREDFMTFGMNKRATSTRATGQIAYENLPNLIEADNNDGPCELNKATYSTDLCRQLLAIYAIKDDSREGGGNGI